MAKLSLAAAAAMTVTAAMVAPSLLARAQSAARFEYLRVTPYQEVRQTPGHVTYRWAGYSACQAGPNEWACREFESAPTDQSNTALRTTLVTLGNEGWDLVSTVDERHELNSEFGGLTYLFKRPRQ